MRRILIILSLLFCISKLSAQNQIIIPKGQDSLFRVVILPWYGLDPIQTKDGNFILPLKVIKDIEAFGIKFPIITETKELIYEKDELKDSVITVTVTPRYVTLVSELKSFPVKDIKDIVLKEPELITEPKVIIK